MKDSRSNDSESLNVLSEQKEASEFLMIFNVILPSFAVCRQLEARTINYAARFVSQKMNRFVCTDGFL